VPLTKYQGGGPEAVLEPLKDHLEDYRQLMMQYYGAGVQACYRGPRLYDSEETRLMVKSTLDWYKKYRYILNSDMIQLRRPDGRDWDGFLHVNPALSEKGFVMLYNPTNETMNRRITIPLYYSGIKRAAQVSFQGAAFKSIPINAQKEMELDVRIPPNGHVWYVVQGN
jgi:hypothetical protein